MSAGVIQQFLLVAGVLIVLVAGSFYLISQFRDSPSTNDPAPEVVIAPEENERDTTPVTPENESSERQESSSAQPTPVDTPAQVPAEQFSQTGPAENAVALFAVTVLTIAVASYLQSRRIVRS